MNNYKDCKDYKAEMKDYWNDRFSKEHMIWGKIPSKTAESALEIFKENKVKKIFIPGIGYGRNSKLFSTNGFISEGLEISETAVEIGKSYDPNSTFHKGSVLDMSFEQNKFDAIYCFNVLHLFREKERHQFIDKCFNVVRNGGVLYFSVFSEEEDSFGKGNQVENNTFESKPGRPVHYFTDTDLKNHFKKFKIVNSGLINDPENHGDGFHIHRLRFICLTVEK